MHIQNEIDYDCLSNQKVLQNLGKNEGVNRLLNKYLLRLLLKKSQLDNTLIMCFVKLPIVNITLSVLVHTRPGRKTNP